MNSEQKNYIIKKYISDELFDEDLNKLTSGFDPNIYPNEGYIPICRQCSSDFENFKNAQIMEYMEVEMKHPSACLWNDYFLKKIKLINKEVKIVKKKNRK